MLRNEIAPHYTFKELLKTCRSRKKKLSALFHALDSDHQAMALALFNYITANSQDAELMELLPMRQSSETLLADTVDYLHRLLDLGSDTHHLMKELELLAQRTHSHREIIDRGLARISMEQEKEDAESLLSGLFAQGVFHGIALLNLPRGILDSAASYIQECRTRHPGLMVWSPEKSRDESRPPGSLCLRLVETAALFLAAKKYIFRWKTLDTLHENRFVYGLRLLDAIRRDAGLCASQDIRRCGLDILGEDRVSKIERFSSLFVKYHPSISDNANASSGGRLIHYLLRQATVTDLCHALKIIEDLQTQITGRINDNPDALNRLVYRHTDDIIPRHETVFMDIDYDLRQVKQEALLLWEKAHGLAHDESDQAPSLRFSYLERMIVNLGRHFGLSEEESVKTARETGHYRIKFWGIPAHEFREGFEQAFLNWSVIAARATFFKVKNSLDAADTPEKKLNTIVSILRDIDMLNVKKPKETLISMLELIPVPTQNLTFLDDDLTDTRDLLPALRNVLAREMMPRQSLNDLTAHLIDVLGSILLDRLYNPMISVMSLTDSEFEESRVHFGGIFSDEEIDEIWTQYRAVIATYTGLPIRKGLEDQLRHARPLNLNRAERLYADLLHSAFKLSLDNAVKVYGTRVGIIDLFWQYTHHPAYDETHDVTVNKIRLGDREIPVVNDSKALFFHGWIHDRKDFPTRVAIHFLLSVGEIMDRDLGYNPQSMFEELAVELSRPRRSAPKSSPQPETSLVKLDDQIHRILRDSSRAGQEMDKINRALHKTRDDAEKNRLYHERSKHETMMKKSREAMAVTGRELRLRLDALSLNEPSRQLGQRGLANGLPAEFVFHCLQSGDTDALKQALISHQQELIQKTVTILG